MASSSVPEAQQDTRNLKETLTYHQRVRSSAVLRSRLHNTSAECLITRPVLQAGGAGHAGMAAEDLCRAG